MQPAVQPLGCGPPRTLPLLPPEGTQPPSPPLGAGLRAASGPLSTAPSPGHPLPTRGVAVGSGEQAPVHCLLGAPRLPRARPGPCPLPSAQVSLWGGEATPLGTLTFQDRDVDGGPQAGQPRPRVSITHVGTWARGGGGPGWMAALHARPAGQPQAAPGPSRQRQEQQEGRGHHPGQGLWPGRKGRERWERKAGSGGLALLSPQRPPRQPGSSPVWGRRWGAQGASWMGRDSWDPSRGLQWARPEAPPTQSAWSAPPGLSSRPDTLMGPCPGLRLLPDTAWGPPLLGGPRTVFPEPGAPRRPPMGADSSWALLPARAPPSPRP